MSTPPLPAAGPPAPPAMPPLPAAGPPAPPAIPPLPAAVAVPPLPAAAPEAPEPAAMGSAPADPPALPACPDPARPAIGIGATGPPPAAAPEAPALIVPAMLVPAVAGVRSPEELPSSPLQASMSNPNAVTAKHRASKPDRLTTDHLTRTMGLWRKVAVGGQIFGGMRSALSWRCASQLSAQQHDRAPARSDRPAKMPRVDGQRAQLIAHAPHLLACVLHGERIVQPSGSGPRTSDRVAGRWTRARRPCAGNRRPRASSRAVAAIARQWSYIKAPL